jgi:LysR family glycine cleavage system transcriptional activator
LNALRAFEAAARLGGFKQAALELCVTPGAVAQHVKALEGWCGGVLFERHAQGVSLSALGRSVLPEFVAAFDAISAASQVLRKRAAPLQVSIAALPSVAQLLLSEWLPVVRRELPQVQLSVTAMEAAPNLQREPFDLTLFFEHGPVLGGIVLGGYDGLVPVCTPAVAAALRQQGSLLGDVHLSDQSWPQDWNAWWEVAVGGAYPGGGPSYSLYAMAVAEALNGAGVLMGHRSLLRPLLDRRALVMAHPRVVEIDAALVVRHKFGSDKALIDRICGIFQRLAGEGSGSHCLS